MGKTLILIKGLHNKDLNGNGPYNWFKCYHSLYNNFIKFNKNYDVYFQTYDSPELKKLIDIYKPIKYISYPLQKIKKYSQLENLYQLIKIVNNIHQYESIFITRFDLLFKMSFDKWNIKNNHINIFFKGPGKNIHYNDVCYFLYPINIIEFKSKIKQAYLNNKNLIALHNIKFDNLHLMTKNEYYSDTDYPDYFPKNWNPYYVLHRKRRKKFLNNKRTFKRAIQAGFPKSEYIKWVKNTE